MSAGIALLRKFLMEGLPLSVLLESGVTRESFSGGERVVYDMVTAYIVEFGTCPQLETVTAETGVKFPDFPDEPIEYWVSKVWRRGQAQSVADAAVELTSLAADGEIVKARDVARGLYRSLDSKGAIDRVHGLLDGAEAAMQAHDRRQKSPGLQGVPFGLEYLDTVSDGAQGSDTVAVVGRPGVGKTYFCLSMANCGFDAGEVPLVVSMEMSVKQCARRIMALRTGVPASMIRLGRLSYFGRDRLITDISSLRQIVEDRPFHLMQGSLSSSVEDLAMRVQELRPTVLYVDGAYLLRTNEAHDSRWERVTYTAEYLKMIATEFDIPVIGTYQFNRRGPGSLGNVAFSDSIGMLASIVVGIADESSEDMSTWSPVSYKTVELLKGREGERGVIRVIYDMARMRILQDRVLKGAGMQALANEGEEDG